MLVNLLPFVFLSLFLGYCLEPLTGATIPNLVKVCRKRRGKDGGGGKKKKKERKKENSVFCINVLLVF